VKRSLTAPDPECVALETSPGGSAAALGLVLTREDLDPITIIADQDGTAYLHLRLPLSAAGLRLWYRKGYVTAREEDQALAERILFGRRSELRLVPSSRKTRHAPGATL
jgi:hypothetical protein